MYAFSRESNVQIRSVLIEKNNNLEIPLFYELENYDTVEAIRGDVRIKGFLSGIVYRSSNENNKHWPYNWVGNIDNIEDYSNVIGYASVTLFCMNDVGGIIDQNLSEIARRRRSSIKEKPRNVVVYIRPCRLVLIEKNLISKHEKLSEEAEEYFRRMFPNFIMGG